MINEGLVKPSEGLVHISVPSISIPRVRSALVHTPFYSSNRKPIKKDIRYAKDLGDIVLGGPLGTKQLRNTLEKYDSVVKDIPILNKLAGLAYMTKDRFIDPLIAGKPGEVFINSLETLGGTLDIFANPIKSLLPVAGGGKEGDFLRSMGWLEGEYRKTYQWDSGNFIVDILGEMISDPTNLLTFGSAGVVKKGIGIAKPTVKEVLSNINVVDDITKKATPLLDVVAKQSPKIQRKIYKQLGDALISSDADTLIKKLDKIFVDQIVDSGADAGKIMFNNTAKHLYMDSVAYKQLQSKLIKASDLGLFKSYKIASRTLDVVNKFDKTFTRIAADITPFGWGKEAVRYLLSPGYAYVHNYILRAASKYTPEEIFDNGPEIFETIKRDALERSKYNYLTNEVTSDEHILLDVLEGNNITFQDAANLYMDTITSAMPSPDAPMDVFYLKELFQKHLTARMDGVYIAKSGDEIYKYLDLQGADVFNAHINRLRVPLLNGKYRNVKVIIPQAEFDKFFWNIHSPVHELWKQQTKFQNTALKVFKQELKQAFTKKRKNAAVFDRPIIRLFDDKVTKNLPPKERRALLKNFYDTVLNETRTINGYIVELKKLALDLLNPKAGWMGSSYEITKFWQMLNDPGPSSTYRALKEILNHGLDSSKATPELQALFKKYAIKYGELTDFIYNMPKQDYIRLDLLNTHDIQKPSAILEALYSVASGLKVTDSTYMYPIRDVLGYIDGGYLRLRNKVYDLNNIRQFYEDAAKEFNLPTLAAVETLPAVINNVKYMASFTDEQRAIISKLAILDYYGITPTNASLVKKLYDKRDALAMSKLNVILEQGKTGRRAYNAQTDAFRNIDMRFKDTSKDENMMKALRILNTDGVEAYNAYMRRYVTPHHRTVDEIKEAVDKSVSDLSAVNADAFNLDEVVDKSIKRVEELGDYVKNLQFSEVKAVDMATYDTLINSAGINMQDFIDMYTKVVNTDLTALDRFNYMTLNSQANAVLDTITRMREYASLNGIKIPSSVKTLFQELEDTMNLVTVNLENSLVEQLDLSEKIYMQQLSREAMTHIIFDKEFNMLDTQYGMLLNELKKPESVARTFVQNLAFQADAMGLPQVGDNLRELLLHIDNHVAVNRLIQMHAFPVYLTFDETTQQFLDSILYNKLASDAYKSFTPVDLLDPANFQALIKDVMQDVTKYIQTNANRLAEAKLDELQDVAKFINVDAATNGIKVKFITNEDIIRDRINLGFMEGKIGSSIGSTNSIIINKDMVNKDDVIRSFNAYSKSMHLDSEDAAKYITNDDEALLSVYFHERSHLLNKDYKKHIEFQYGPLGQVMSEVTARANQIKALSDVATRENLLRAEIVNLVNTYEEEAMLYLNMLKTNEFNLGMSNTRVYDILDGRMLETAKQLGVNQRVIKEALDEFSPESAQFISDYDMLTGILYGQRQINSQNYALFGLSHFDKTAIKELNETFTNKSFLYACYDAFSEIGMQNQRLAGTTGSTKVLGDMHNLMTSSKVTEYLNRIGDETNIFNWSVANKDLAFKTVYDPAKAAALGITPYDTIIVTSQEDYLNFYKFYVDQYNRAKQIYEHFNVDMLEQIRDSLIDTFKHAGIPNAPKDAYSYFHMLDFNNPEDRLKLITWDGIAQNPQHSYKTASYYKSTLRDKLYINNNQALTNNFELVYEKDDVFRNPWRWYQMVDTAVEQARLNNIEPLKKVLDMDLPGYILEDLYTREDYNLASLYKSSDKLLNSPMNFTKYINDDLKARRGTIDLLTDTMSDLDNYTIHLNKLDPETRKFFKGAGVNDYSKLSSREAQRALKEYIEAEQYQTILDSTADELRHQIDMRGGFFILTTEYSTKIEFPFKNIRPEELRAKGIEWVSLGRKVKKNKQGVEEEVLGDWIYILRRTDKNNTKTPIRWKKFEEMVKEPGIKKMFDAKEKLFNMNKNYIDMSGIDMPYYYLTGDTMDVALYDYIRTMPELYDFFGDIEFQKSYLDLTESGISNFYTGAYARPQVTIVGRNGYNRFLDYVKNELNSPVNWSYKSNSLANSLQVGMTDWITRHNNKTKLLSVIFNDEFNSNNEFFHKMLDGKDDKFLQEFFSKGRYTAVIAKEGKHGEPIVAKYFIRNAKQLKEAQQLGAAIVPDAVYRNMIFTINKNAVNSKLMMLYRRTIVGMFKSIWLTSPGFLLRNFLDSEIYKNMNETGGLVPMIDMFKYEYQAAKLLDQANQIQAEVFARTNNKTFNKAVLTDVLMGLSPEERTLYYLTDTFLNSGASGSLTNSMQDFLLQFNKSGVDATEYTWERALNHAVFEGKLSPTRMIMDVNGKIEQSARYGLFLALIDKGGANIDEALARVIKTHFDYTAKSGLEDILEQLFWFVTFPMNNIMYFVNGGLERNPNMLKVFMDMNEQSWNNGEYTYDEIKEKPYLQYHAMAGNIRFRSKDGKKDYIIKLGPSLFDFFNFMVDPIGEATNRLNPFISVPLGLDDASELVPFRAQISRTKTMLQTGNLIPSILSTITLRDYKRKRRTNYYTYSGGNWNFKRRPRKVYPKPTYYSGTYNFVRNNYPKKGYWKRNKYSTNWFATIDRRPYRQPKVPLDPRFFRQVKRLPKIPTELRPMVDSSSK